MPTLAPLIFATVVAVADAVPPAPTPPLADVERAIVASVNEARRQHGLASLGADPTLADVARRHSCAMAEQRFFDHTAPDGTTMRDRFLATGLRYETAGENLALIEGRDPVARAVAGWLKSPTHRENMLSPRFVTTGVGACRAGRAVYFTQIFLRPR